jgi:hypothetical protein
LEFNVEAGYDLEINDITDIGLGDYTAEEIGLSPYSFVCKGNRLTIQLDENDFLSDILDPEQPDHTLTFPAGSLSDSNGNTNSSTILIKFRTPAQPSDFFLVTDNNSLIADTSYTTTPAGTQVFSIFKKAEFEKEHNDLNDCMDLVPRDLLEGKLIQGGNDVRALPTVTNTIDALSMVKDLGTPIQEEVFTVVLTTSTPAGGIDASDKGANLFATKVAEGLVIDDHTNRPTLSSPKNLISYSLETPDSEGYNAYLIVNFNEAVSSNLIDESGNSQLALGIDMKFPSFYDHYTNIQHVDYGFDAEIIDGRLVIKMKKEPFMANAAFSMRIPAGTVKNMSGRANSSDLTIVDYFMIDELPFKLGQIKTDSVDLTIGSTSNYVELGAYDSAKVYNYFIKSDSLSPSQINDYMTLQSSSEDTDYTITGANTIEYINFSSNAVGTTLDNLMPETNYYWVTTVEMSNHNYDLDIMEGQVYKFTTLPAGSNRMTQLEYNTGTSSAVNNDDYLVATFSHELTASGSEDDYTISLDYDSSDGIGSWS